MNDNLKKLKSLLWGMFWAGLGGLTTGLSDVLVTLASYDSNDWDHTWKVVGVGGLLGAAGYLKQQQALFSPPPVALQPAVPPKD